MAKVTIASLTARIAELETELAKCRGGEINEVVTDTGLIRYAMPGVTSHGHNHTPSAVDAIRVYTWAAMAKGVEKKEIIAALISQKFTPSTVRARVSRIFNGQDESCYSEEIRARLGLDELDEIADAVEMDEQDEQDAMDREDEESGEEGAGE